MPKVSVIVPIYNVEKYIERCARSLFMQTLDDVEYIFIDDCTPDKSMDILMRVMEDFPHRMQQCKCVKMPSNGGLPLVRRCGLTYATGDYIIHCDSDDWIDLRMLEDLYREAVESMSDIVICDFYQTDLNQKIYVKSGSHYNKESYFYDSLSGKLVWALWNKLVRHTLYDKVQVFPCYNMGEDMVLSIQLIHNAAKISYIENAYYYYYVNQSSIVRGNSQDQVKNRFYQAVGNAILLENELNKYKSGVKYTFALDSLKLRQRNILNPLLSDYSYYKLWMSTFPELLFRVWINPFVSFKEKVKFYLKVLRLYKR